MLDRTLTTPVIKFMSFFQI